MYKVIDTTLREGKQSPRVNFSLRKKKQIPPNQPIIGKDIFTCETGLHLLGLQKDPRTYEPYPPEKTVLYSISIFSINFQCHPPWYLIKNSSYFAR